MPNSAPKLKNDWTGYWKLMSKSERNPEEGARSSPSVTAWCQRSDSRTVSYWAYSLALATLSSWSLYGSKGHRLSLLYTSMIHLHSTSRAEENELPLSELSEEKSSSGQDTNDVRFLSQWPYFLLGLCFLQLLQTFHHIETSNIANDPCMKY